MFVERSARKRANITETEIEIFCPRFNVMRIIKHPRQKGKTVRPRIPFLLFKISHSPPIRAWTYLRRIDFFFALGTF
jgi:hypothetical protein